MFWREGRLARESSSTENSEGGRRWRGGGEAGQPGGQGAEEEGWNVLMQQVHGVASQYEAGQNKGRRGGDCDVDGDVDGDVHGDIDVDGDIDCDVDVDL